MSSVEIHAGYLRLVETDRHADFHFRWLRHNNEHDRHPTTGERTIDSAELPDQLAVVSADLVDGVLRVRWRDDERVSRYPLEWLRRHAYAIDRVAVPRPPSQVSALEIDGAGSLVTIAGELVARLGLHGAAVVRREHANPQAETEAWIEALAAQGLEIVGTHFGRIEDLRTDNTTNENTDQLGYTDAAIDLHTDQPFLEAPPRYQLLQGIREAKTGGDTVLADGEAAFRYLESIDRGAAELLTSTKISFHRKQKNFEREVVSPIVSIRDGRVFVRSSYFTEAPYQVGFERMAAWYRAHDQFVRILRDPQNHYAFRIRPGDVLVYDNHRMLHGRTAFEGARWIRGVYFNAPRTASSDDDTSG